MQYAICPLSIVPLRREPKDTSELISQVLYGEFFKVLERRKKWSRIRLSYDKYEGWIDNKQYQNISKEIYKQLESSSLEYSGDLVEFATTNKGTLLPILQGSTLNGLTVLEHTFEGLKKVCSRSKSALVHTALAYLKAPYLWGGRTHFGIDCSGFTQMIYKLNGYQLLRDASQQATQGEVLSFIEECEPGDLAFFDNEEGAIIHVGMILRDHQIIHAHGEVRIDHIDQTGIYNASERVHTHTLRMLKKII